MRRAWISCLASALLAPALIAIPAAAAKPVRASTSRKKAPATAKKHPLCSALASLSAVRQATGLAGTKLRGTYSFTKSGGQFWAYDEASHGSLPGSECEYNDPTPGTSYTQEVFNNNEANDDYVTVGYGESASGWHAYEAALKSKGGGSPPETALDVPTSGLNGHAPVSALTLDHATKAFLETGDLVAAGDAVPPPSQFPTTYYIVTAETKHDDVIQVGLYGASLVATETFVEGVLKAHPTF
jgi:hypothetical protein